MGDIRSLNLSSNNSGLVTYGLDKAIIQYRSTGLGSANLEAYQSALNLTDDILGCDGDENVYGVENGVWVFKGITESQLYGGTAGAKWLKAPSGTIYTTHYTYIIWVLESPSSDNSALTSVGGSAQTSIPASAFTAGSIIHGPFSSVTVGTNGHFMLRIPK